MPLLEKIFGKILFNMRKSQPFIQHEMFIPLFRAGIQSGIPIYKNLFESIFDRDLTKNISSANILMNRIDSMSKNYLSFGYQDTIENKYNEDGELVKITKSGSKKFKGDLFEIFAELFFKILGHTKTISVIGYIPEESEEDYGVDGFARSKTNSPLTVQCKFRSRADSLLEERDIKQFLVQSWKKYKVNMDSKNAVLFTSCEGMYHTTEREVFLDSITTINIKDIRLNVDRSLGFWEKVVELIDTTLFTELPDEEYNRTLTIINPIRTNN